MSEHKFQSGFTIIILIILILLFGIAILGYFVINDTKTNTSTNLSGLDLKVKENKVTLDQDQTFITLNDLNHVYLLKDGHTEFRLKKIHTVLSSEAPGYPAINIDEDWLEIVNKTVYYNKGFLFTIENKGCTYKSVWHDDYASPYLDNCALKVTQTKADVADIAPEEINVTLSREDLVNGGFNNRPNSAGWRDDGVANLSSNDYLFVIRFGGYYMGNMDTGKNSSIPLSIESGFDIITSFGVNNIELSNENTPIINYEETHINGPMSITFKILDVGNTNTHCNTGSCKNVFDLSIQSKFNNKESRTPKILEYY
ncbi:MAG: hypothetical protein US39_C0014G0030 [Microgenomates group bacterium GW2011_GWC1_37_12b]|nr:MAG: hypothetical protein US39_C0014G0030 [Microgenomates group bacterium GW2011_GWC1_37_12b]